MIRILSAAVGFSVLFTLPLGQVQAAGAIKWRGVVISNKACFRDVKVVKRLSAKSVGKRMPANSAEFRELTEFANKSERLRLDRSCREKSSGFSFKLFGDAKKTGSLLSAVGAKPPAGVDRNDPMAVDLYQDIILHGNTRKQANAMVGKALWRDLLKTRHLWFKAKKKFD